MSAMVPKLNYAVRNKSKSKNSQSESSEKRYEGSSELFSHMNQDNLKYIQTQIKEKHKKHKKQQKQIKPSPQIQPKKLASKYYETDNKIQEKDSWFEETQRAPESDPVHINEVEVIKTESDGNNNRAKRKGIKRETSQANSNKISYYDLISQGKSKRVSSIEGFFDEENQNQTEELKQLGFLGFLDTYIKDLNQSPRKAEPLEKISQNKKKSHFYQNDVFIDKIKEEKNKAIILAIQLEKHKNIETENSKKIKMLENVMQDLVNQVFSLKKEVAQTKNRLIISENMRKKEDDFYDRIHERKSDYGDGMRNTHRGSQDQKPLHLRMSRNKADEIIQLQIEKKAFEEKGQLQLRNSKYQWY